MKLLHNFGELNPIPVGAVALCGAISTYEGSGEVEPEVSKVCPICFALTTQVCKPAKWVVGAMRHIKFVSFGYYFGGYGPIYAV